MFEMAVLLDALSTAALDVADINSSVSAANAAAVAPTTGISVAAGDEVSAAIAALLSSYGREYRALSAEVAVFHSQFVHALDSAANAYSTAEAANASAISGAVKELTSPVQALLGGTPAATAITGGAGTAVTAMVTNSLQG